MDVDYLIVGAGFAGSVCARQLAEAGKTVKIIDKRNHVGGNAFDKVNEHGQLIHPYGPHIFHTNSRKVFEYLSRFTTWRFYEHRVLGLVDGQLVPIPINRQTINRLYALDLDEQGVKDFFESQRERRDPVQTSEDVVLNSVGRELCEKFFRGYTRKQWGLDLSELSAGVAARIPTRTDDDDRYFSDALQFMPADGYTAMFEKMLDHPNILIEVSSSFRAELQTASHTIYTGPIDEFYEYRYGRLPYRSLRFDHSYLPETDKLQPVGTVNYPQTEEFTRITEFKHLTGETSKGTSIVKEYPSAVGEPYYPIPRPENEALYKKYAALAETETTVSFVGRLAQYRYYNMDQVVAAALALSARLSGRHESA